MNFTRRFQVDGPDDLAVGYTRVAAQSSGTLARATTTCATGTLAL